MTGQEVWEAWKKNLSAKFKSNSNDRVMVIVNGIPRWEHNDKEVAIYSFMNHCWQPVEEWREVEFLEAIEAWVKGATIKCVSMNGSFFIYDSQFLESGENKMALSRQRASIFDWYIKE